MPDYSNDSPMELLYTWINSDETAFIQQQGFNFSPNYEFKMKQNSQNQYELTCTEYPDYHNIWNINRGTHQITNLTAIVGNNGSGKTSLLRHLANASILPIEKDDDSSETDTPDETYECAKMVLIFRCGTNIRILYNFNENEELQYDNSKFAGLHISKENYSVAKELLDNHTTIYLSNAYSSSRSIWESEWGQAPIVFSPTSNYERANIFFQKICGLNFVNEHIKSNEDSSHLNEDEPFIPNYPSLDPHDKYKVPAFCYLQENIASHKNYKDFERLCAISRYHHLHSEESSTARMIADSKDLIIGVANFYTLTNQLTNKKSNYYEVRHINTLARIQNKFKGFQRESHGTAPIHSVLFTYLTLEQEYLRRLLFHVFRLFTSRYLV